MIVRHEPALEVLASIRDRALAEGRLQTRVLDDPDRLLGLLARRPWTPAAGAHAEWRADFPGGTVSRFGSPDSFRRRHYQIELDGALVTLPEPESWAAPVVLTAAPLRVARVAAADDEAPEVARGLRDLGLRVHALAPGRDDLTSDLADSGIPAFPPDRAPAADVVVGAAAPWEEDLEAACTEVLAPLDGLASQVVLDLTLPTCPPYGRRNRHATDGPVVRVKGASVFWKYGPWTAYTLGEATVRAPLSAEAFAQRLEALGEVRVLPPRAGAVLDAVFLQNILFGKLGAVYDYRTTAAVTPLPGEGFRVTFLVPAAGRSIRRRLRQALTEAGLCSGPEEVRARVDRSLGVDLADARLRATWEPARVRVEVSEADAPRPEAPEPPVPEEARMDSVLRREHVTLLETSASGPFVRARAADRAETLVLRDGVPFGWVEEDADGHTLRTRPVMTLDLEDPAQRAFYFHHLLDFLRAHALERGAILRVRDAAADELKAFLAGRALAFRPDPDAPGRSRAPFAFGRLAGVRYRLGSERVPERDRVVQVDLFRRDDPSPAPRSVTVTFGPRAEDPLLVMPTTVQLVMGFGQIAGDLGVIERRLGYRVVAWNRSPNERALHALENGIPLYALDDDGGEQRRAYREAGVPLAGEVRDLLENGLEVGRTDAGHPVRARVGHILDGLFGTVRHPETGKTVKTSELYRERLFAEWERRGVPTIYNGYNNPDRVAEGRVFVHDAFRLLGQEPPAAGRSVMCVSCNTTNITSLFLRLVTLEDGRPIKARVLTARKANDPFAGEGKQTVNYQGLSFAFHYHHWEDAEALFAPARDRIRSVTTHATGQAGTEFHTGVVFVDAPADVLRRELARARTENLQLVEFPDHAVDATRLLEVLHRRIGIRNLYVQPVTVVPDGQDAIVVFFTPHIFNVKPNNLVAALNRDGLVANSIRGIEAASSIVAELLRLRSQQRALARYFPTPFEPAASRPRPIYRFRPGEVDAAEISSREERRRLLGGKGAGLSELAMLTYRDPDTGEDRPVPVPPGYTITTCEARRVAQSGGQLPSDLVRAVQEAHAWLERATGKGFGSPDDPLLVSVRSGAPASMPGMMDTILNLGLNDVTVEGLARRTGNRAFARECYARLVAQYARSAHGVELDADLGVEACLEAFRAKTGRPFPQDPWEQLLGAIRAVFASAQSERALRYRQLRGIPDEEGVSACSVVAMVFGNLDPDSGTGVCFTRNPLTGQPGLCGEWLARAQGEDVVSGTRVARPLEEMGQGPTYRHLAAIAEALERHYGDAQDIEFTVEQGRLWILQTRSLGGRTGRAALRIAADFVAGGLATVERALLAFGDPARLGEVLAPAFDPEAVRRARSEGRLLARGLAASAGAACGRLALSAQRALEMARQGEPVVLARPETSPADVGAMAASVGILTTRGGMTCHAAIVARGMGKAAVVGAEGVEVDEEARALRAGDRLVPEGEWVAVDGATGEAFQGRLDVVPSAVRQAVAAGRNDPELERLLLWAGEHKAMEVRANAEVDEEIRAAVVLGAEGVGLARTERAMLRSPEGRTALAALILAEGPDEVRRALEALEPLMEADSLRLFRALGGRPATVRLFDPVPNEFLPRDPDDVERLAAFLGIRPAELARRVERRFEINPMLGNRGVRLVMVAPEIARAQARAILRGAARAARQGVPVRPEIEIPLVIHETEVRVVAAAVRQVAAEVSRESGLDLPCRVGVMVETPAAVRAADAYARDIDFIWFGMNDLTQTVLALSRDDTGRLVPVYESAGIFAADPFKSLDRVVATFVSECVLRARAANPDIRVGAAGDLGGDPYSVEAFHRIGLDMVSASTWLIPVTLLASAQANLRYPRRR